MKTLNLKDLENWYIKNHQSLLRGRQITFKDINPILTNLPAKFDIEALGNSDVNKIPIYKISVGNGKKRILIWSQMHGNESTGTKAIFDLFNFIISPSKKFTLEITNLLNQCTLVFIPLLNPDGAIKFTRENGNNIDLNRDAVALKAGESNLLRSVLDKFRPHFCFNLHDQRSIFNVKGTSNPATISFLAPSEDIERTITDGRKETMSVIVAMNNLLQQKLPNHIGRYTDEFYPTATGDNFQKLGHNTILIEAGHYKEDYAREEVRKLNFYALIQGLFYIANTKNYSNYKPYFKIPNNNTLFLDVIYTNVLLVKKDKTVLGDVGIQYKFKVEKGNLIRYAEVEKTGDLTNYSTYTVVDAKKCTFNELLLRIS